MIEQTAPRAAAQRAMRPPLPPEDLTRRLVAGPGWTFIPSTPAPFFTFENYAVLKELEAGLAEAVDAPVGVASEGRAACPRLPSGGSYHRPHRTRTWAPQAAWCHHGHAKRLRAAELRPVMAPAPLLSREPGLWRLGLDFRPRLIRRTK